MTTDNEICIVECIKHVPTHNMNIVHCRMIGYTPDEHSSQKKGPLVITNLEFKAIPGMWCVACFLNPISEFLNNLYKVKK